MNKSKKTNIPIYEHCPFDGENMSQKMERDSITELKIRQIISPFFKSHSNEVVEDFAMFLTYIFCLEIGVLRYTYNSYKELKEIVKNYSNRQKRIKHLILELTRELNKHIEDKNDFGGDSTIESRLSKYLLDYHDHYLFDEYLFNSFEFTCSIKNNFIYSQKVSTPNGFRDMLIRLLCVSIQVNFYDEYMNNKYHFVKLIDNLLNSDITRINSTLTENEIYKLIQHIDIKNKEQTYKGTFISAVTELYKDESALAPHLSLAFLYPKWRANNRSFENLRDFIDLQLTNHKDNILFPSDYLLFKQYKNNH